MAKLGSHYTMPDERRVIVSVATKAGMASPEVRKRLSAAHMGKKVSPETRAKISVALKGRTGNPKSEETRTKMSVAAMGHVFRGVRHHTPEAKAKMSMTLMGNTFALGCRHSEAANVKASAIRIGSLNPHWQGGITPEKMKGYKRKANAKRRGLSYVYLNSWFVGCEGHHINKTDVIYIPEAMHSSIYHRQDTGQGMAEMNALAGQYLTEDWT